jgi:hypothetical protein
MESFRGEQDRLTLADKRVYDQECKVLINTVTEKFIAKLQQDKR